MADAVREWFPKDALTVDRIGLALRECLQGWRDRWLATQGLGISVKASAPMSAQAAQNAVLHARTYAHLSLPAPGKRYLLEHVLGETLSGRDLTADDHRLLDELAGKAAADLVDSLDALLKFPLAASEPKENLSIVIDGQEIFRFAYSLDSMIAQVRRTMSGASRCAPAFVSRTRAIGACRAEVQSLLGSVALTIEELHELGVGDVLILDSRLDDPVSLQLRETGGHIRYGKPRVVDGRNAIGF